MNRYDPNDPYDLPVHLRYAHEFKVGAVALSLLIFLGIYKVVSPVENLVNKVAYPAVEGTTKLYSKVSTPIFKLTGLNLGFVARPPDPDFIFRVQLATYINLRQPVPLLDIAVNGRNPTERREAALRALFKFDSTSEWIKPFLNEIAKGGMVGLYDEKSPLLDELIKQIRAEGGIAQPLVRAYAEVVFSFMMQAPDAVVRKKALRWVSDVIPEEALFQIAERIPRETEDSVRVEIEDALWNIRAVSEPQRALKMLSPLYKKPPWPELRTPLAVVLARLGADNLDRYLSSLVQGGDLTEEELLSVRVAMAHTRYPKEIHVTQVAQLKIRERKRLRDAQYQSAWARQQQIIREQRIKELEAQMAQAPQEEPGTKTPAVAVAPPLKRPAVATVPAEQPAKTPKVAKVPVEETAPVAPEETTAPVPPAPVEAPKTAEAPVPHEEVHVAPSAPVEPPQVANLPPQEEAPPPPPPPVPPQPEASMRYVDIIFEVKSGEVPLFANPGEDTPTGVFLAKGAKGKASFEVLVGDERWLQVKSKEKNGWAKASLLKAYDLSPTASEPAAAKPKEMADENRKESTYFEPTAENVIAYQKPNTTTKQVGTLIEGVSYLAIKSEKVGPDRWFLLEVQDGVEGWVEGINLQLADVAQPAQQAQSENPLSQKEKKSAFAAEWVTPSVVGVAIYNRPSIAGKILMEVSPPNIYQVLDQSEGGGQEWYKIKLGPKKEGWVQSMDVSLTKPN